MMERFSLRRLAVLGAAAGVVLAFVIWLEVPLGSRAALLEVIAASSVENYARLYQMTGEPFHRTFTEPLAARLFDNLTTYFPRRITIVEEARRRGGGRAQDVYVVEGLPRGWAGLQPDPYKPPQPVHFAVTLTRRRSGRWVVESPGDLFDDFYAHALHGFYGPRLAERIEARLAAGSPGPFVY